eukprot:CAMPEP_0181244626 /NCGR_PEP_ID=MMETSP1096-20121128/42966_1 /TAXON_ID=156174 ORGANISM="Chrysochromulina ericina, Strain CCMP281" /NCGR_SAMPLE_ID=MMETSP1096 /ASSEMBLY_ACC=CAM_ASM_000453 /LENGTH=104 /DNA_ID=CAMNT_0023341199 /DNA_START=300 /DNA_END=614 /DNA_ORIENTATION=-
MTNFDLERQCDPIQPGRGGIRDPIDTSHIKRVAQLVGVTVTPTRIQTVCGDVLANNMPRPASSVGIAQHRTQPPALTHCVEPEASVLANQYLSLLFQDLPRALA